MRRIERSSAFRRDFKRVNAAPRHRDIGDLLSDAMTLLATDAPLPSKHRDHQLGGNWSSFRECHLKPDVLLIYPQGRRRASTRAIGVPQ